MKVILLCPEKGTKIPSNMIKITQVVDNRCGKRCGWLGLKGSGRGGDEEKNGGAMIIYNGTNATENVPDGEAVGGVELGGQLKESYPRGVRWVTPMGGGAASMRQFEKGKRLQRRK